MSNYNYMEKAKCIFDATDTDAVLLINESNMHYFCGFSPSEGVVLIINGKCGYHLVDSRYTECAEGYAKNSGLSVIEVNGKFSKIVSNICKENDVHCIAFEDETISLHEYKNYTESIDAKFVGIGNTLIEARNIKTDEEIENVSKANEIAEKSFDELLNYVEVGRSERELSAMLEYFMAKNGSEGVSFPTILLCGSHTSLPHGVPSDRVISEGDFVLFDFGATYNGYCSDMTRTVAVKYASEEMSIYYNLVLRSQLAGIEALRAGVPCSAAYAASYDVLEEMNMGKYFRHSLGHGIGLDIHEGYNLSPRSKDVLKCGNLTSVEPGIYIPDKFGIRIEDMCLVTDDGCQIITNTPKELIVL